MDFFFFFSHLGLFIETSYYEIEFHVKNSSLRSIRIQGLLFFPIEVCVNFNGQSESEN